MQYPGTSGDRCRPVRWCTSRNARKRSTSQKRSGFGSGGGVGCARDHATRAQSAWKACLVPLDELHWCEVQVPASCRPLMMVHELAHTCGWEHDAGMGVPGNGGKLWWTTDCE